MIHLQLWSSFTASGLLFPESWFNFLQTSIQLFATDWLSLQVVTTSDKIYKEKQSRNVQIEQMTEISNKKNF